MLLCVAAAALLIGYGIGRRHHGEPTAEQRIAKAYGHRVGHCTINDQLTQAIRKAGGGQTAYRCGDAGYSAIINAAGTVFIGGRIQPQR